jgi:predicted ATPase
MRRLKGELLLMQWAQALACASEDDRLKPVPPVEAARCFGDAIEVARRQGAKWLELRATLSLARLLIKQSRQDETRTMLAEIYGWFTEGFDTADLKDAKALLDELSA